MLRPYLCDHSDAYIVVKGTIDLLAAAAANENYKVEKDVAFKNNAPFRSCFSKINSHQEVYGIIIKTKLTMLMIMLQMVNLLNIKQK